MRKTYIADGLKQYLEQNHNVWHMPGHKRKAVWDKEQATACSITRMLDSSYAYDVTEVPGTDELYEPEGFIKESLEQLKEIYGTCGSYYIVNGATGGIFAAIHACTNPGDKVIMAKNCHKSVYNAVKVLGLTAVYAKPTWKHREEALFDITNTIEGYISAEEMEQLCKDNPDATAIILTSPTYDGIVSDISAIREISKKYQKYLIVDEAHGAHLPFLDPMLSAVSMGADVVVQSLHKTLPALTQTALVHVCNAALCKRAEQSISMFMSSSPSYIMMLSMEQAICFAANEDCENYKTALRKFRNSCNILKKIHLLDPTAVQAAGAFGYDETRLVFFADVAGPVLLSMLAEAGDIVCEMAGEKHVVLISTMVDTEEDFLQLYKTLSYVDKKLDKTEHEKQTEPSVYADEAGWYNRIATKAQQPIYVYPPGSYIVQAGEMITKESVEKIVAYKQAGLKIRGE